jgi:cell wall-associated NlpC family hydrolase
MVEKEKNPAFFYVNSSVQNDSTTCDSLLKFASNYLKKPYCYGSNPPKCFDCSGFVNFVFGNFGKVVPNSSGAIALQGKFISFKNASKADLIFFTGRNSQSETVGHVGIVTEYKDGLIYFIHASVQAGVIVSNTGEEYYKKRLLFVKRIKL